jgi:signal peptidase
MKKLFEFAGLIAAAAIMLAAVMTYLAPHFGWHVDAVLSGSMEPELRTGALVVSRPVDADSIQVGDIITFRQDGRQITHRVIGVSRNSPLQFQTKGDASENPDVGMVPEQNVVGRVCVHIPLLGRFTEFLKTPAGFISGVIVPALVLSVVYVINIVQVLMEKRRYGGYCW